MNRARPMAPRLIKKHYNKNLYTVTYTNGLKENYLVIVIRD